MVKGNKLIKTTKNTTTITTTTTTTTTINIYKVGR